MGQQYKEISDEVKEFIEKQKIFFVGTVIADSILKVEADGL